MLSQLSSYAAGLGSFRHHPPATAIAPPRTPPAPPPDGRARFEEAALSGLFECLLGGEEESIGT